MNPEKKNELLFELKTITNITIKAREAFLIVKYLYQEDQDEDVSYTKTMNAFLGYSKFIYWQMLVIELSKLFYFNATNKSETGKRERFNLRHFLKKLRKDGHFSEARIQEIKIDGWLERLDNEDENITNLLTQRDKLYAHEDGQDIDNILSLEKTNEILSIALEIVKEVNLSFFGRGIDFSPIPSPSDNLKHLIGVLARHRDSK